ncbi:hypothetical protein PCIT_a3329 [Pseudoalteromonas citrea]|uniref:Uncharacterized protein n=1 Tax=Pseudoalteromonas citrea TaxID=43655 RepID=A0AAD4FR09_9GAMM|nr:hypothetical protein PCIT_a3329 [Pseudoalteromonas citrea]
MPALIAGIAVFNIEKLPILPWIPHTFIYVITIKSQLAVGLS